MEILRFLRKDIGYSVPRLPTYKLVETRVKAIMFKIFRFISLKVLEINSQ